MINDGLCAGHVELIATAKLFLQLSFQMFTSDFTNYETSIENGRKCKCKQFKVF